MQELICFSAFLYHYIDSSVFLEVAWRGATAPLAPTQSITEGQQSLEITVCVYHNFLQLIQYLILILRDHNNSGLVDRGTSIILWPLAHMYPCMYRQIHTLTLSHTHSHMHARTHTHTHAHTHKHMHTHMHTHTHTHTHTNAHADTDTHAHAHTHARTHAHTHNYTFLSSTTSCRKNFILDEIFPALMISSTLSMYCLMSA